MYVNTLLVSGWLPALEGEREAVRAYSGRPNVRRSELRLSH